MSIAARNPWGSRRSVLTSRKRTGGSGQSGIVRINALMFTGRSAGPGRCRRGACRLCRAARTPPCSADGRRLGRGRIRGKLLLQVHLLAVAAGEKGKDDSGGRGEP